ncbi:hypothetical protein Leryth_008904 [Lithospermum erythrorhizon]|nr:hypothetical protein Leryth_008904 [Lithospermum erythrorhizon]
MRGTKRLAVSDSNSMLNDSSGKKVFGGWKTDSSRPESSQTQQQQVSTLPFDMQRADLSRQHVRALNTQFASWVQSQLQNHPDELWQDGARDYLNHASHIMEKFDDVVNWLKENVANGETGVVSGSDRKNIRTDIKDSNKSGAVATSLTGTTGSSWGFGGQNNVLSNSNGVDKPSSATLGNALGGASSIDENNKSVGALPSTTGIFGGSWGSGGPKSSESKQISNNLSSDKTINTPANTTASFGSTVASFGGTTPSFGGTAASFGGTTPSFGGTAANFGSTVASFGGTTPSFGGTTPSLGGSWISGTSFNNNSPFSFGIQTSVASSQSLMPVTSCGTNEEEDGEDAAEQPGSPSFKMTEEKGIMVVHEVKCKLYVKSTDPESGWKDKGTGQLSIKCKEGVPKGTKESKPTIIVRNDVGRVSLNALLYPGIKTNLQKNAVVAIFHSSGDGDDINSVVARTFLMRTRTVEDRDKLAAAIKEYAPTA